MRIDDGRRSTPRIHELHASDSDTPRLGILKAGIPVGSVPPPAITPVVTRYLSSDRTVPAFVGKILMRRRHQEWNVAWVKFATSRTRRRRSASMCGSMRIANSREPGVEPLVASQSSNHQ